jgi:hypothetical protein
MSTTFHPHTDGQSEVVNKVIAMYLRCVTGDRPHRGWIGSRGRSTATTPPSILHSAPPHSRSSMGAHPRRSYLTWWGHPRRRRQTRSSAAVKRCWLRCTSSFYRHNNSLKSTTTPTIVKWSSTSAPGCGCASSTRPRSRSTRRLGASWVPAMLARSRCWSASARSPTDYSF